MKDEFAGMELAVDCARGTDGSTAMLDALESPHQASLIAELRAKGFSDAYLARAAIEVWCAHYKVTRREIAQTRLEGEE